MRRARFKFLDTVALAEPKVKGHEAWRALVTRVWVTGVGEKCEVLWMDGESTVVPAGALRRVRP